MRLMLLLAFLTVTTQTFCQTAGEHLQTKLDTIRSMTAEFKQTVRAKKRELSNSSGLMAFQRPGRFRWQTKEPMEQLVVADGQNIWVYDVDLEQVSVKKQNKGMGGTAALFLSGYGESVTKDFSVTETSKGKQVTFDLRAISSKENFQRIQLIFTQDNLTGLELFDQLGQVTSVKLGHIKANPKLAASFFQFNPPKGVDVVRQ